MDNAAYHKSKEADEFIKKTNITIAPYCPWMNPV